METEETRIRNFERPAGQGACLVVIHAADRRLLGMRVPLAGELHIGREAGNDLVIDDPDVSRHHALVLSEGAGHAVRDLGSTNGTWVNDAEVEKTPLRSGDQVRLGSAVVKYLAGGDIEALYHAEVQALAQRDGLTGAHNRRHLGDFLEREVARCHRHGRPLSLILLDVDHFKRINDEHGHLAGDEVLRSVARLVASMARREDCFARYGGEEFALVLPETPLDGARKLGDRIRAQVEGEAVAHEGRRLRATVSAGVAELGEGVERPEDLLAAADARLYEAKRGGRNRVAG
jgi:diguanylate cyclase (GGDEF)-like protein